MLSSREEIKTYHTDGGGALKMSTALRMIQHMGTADGERMGFVREEMLKFDRLFILTKSKVVFNRPIVYKDDVKLFTFAPKPKGVIMERFTTFSVGEEVVATAVSDWALIDTKSRRPVKTTDFIENLDLTEERLPIKSDKIAYPKEDGFFTSRIVRYSDLDPNLHLNNTVYADVVCDCLGRESLAIKSFSINYKAEAKLGDEIIINCVELADKSFVFGGKIGERECFTAKIELNN